MPQSADDGVIAIEHITVLDLLTIIQNTSIAPVSEKYFTVLDALVDLVNVRTGPTQVSKGLIEHKTLGHSTTLQVSPHGDLLTAIYVPADFEWMFVSLQGLPIERIDIQHKTPIAVGDTLSDAHDLITIDGEIYRRVVPFWPFLPLVSIDPNIRVRFAFPRQCSVYVEFAFANPEFRTSFTELNVHKMAHMMGIRDYQPSSTIPLILQCSPVVRKRFGIGVISRQFEM